MHDDEDLNRTAADAAAAPVIAALRATDDELGANAEAVWNTLTWGEGIGSITQEAVQNFLWYQLPLKWLAPVEDDICTTMAEAAAALCDGLGLDRYAAICRSPVTADVHAAYRRSASEGRRAFRRAAERSGIDPPDLDDFAWGSMMGSHEASARSTVAMALEQAIAVGEFTPGGRGWRDRQRAVTAATLDRPHPNLPTQIWRSAILTERIEHWVSLAQHRSPALGALRARHANRLLHAAPTPADVAERLSPLLWLLGEIQDREGVGLTQTGALNRTFVIEATRRWEWWDPEMRGPNRQDDVWQLGALHDLAAAAARPAPGAAGLSSHRWGGAWSPTSRWCGKRSCRGWLAPTSSPRWWPRPRSWSCWTTTGSWPPRTCGRPSPTLLPSRAGGLAATVVNPGEREVRWAGRPWLQAGRLFGLVHELGEWRSRQVRFTPAGEAATVAYLRSRAAGPRSGLFA